jgi:VTC domain-containing protein
MTYVHRMQSNRFEFKYMVDERKARAIRDYARSFLVHDEYADPKLAYSYSIHSIYLDSQSFSLAQATLQGLKNRFKLRIRFYDDKPDNPVFFEIKRRLNDVICKERVAVHRASVQGLLRRRFPERSDLVHFTPKAFDTLRHFCSLRNAIEANKGILVSYLREAYVTPHDDSVRLTFDRDITSGHFDEHLRINRLADRFQPRVQGVILELKFTDRFPFWMHDLVREFNLQRCPMAKYVACAVSLDSLTTGLLAV